MIKPVASFARARWEGIRASYWFIPSWMIALAFLIGYLCISYVPVYIPDALYQNYIPHIAPEDASDLISAIASAIITATSIAFSMTLVALTMASSQFGPRLLQTFMDDRGTQLVLGALTSTFIFCLSALHRISVAETDMLVSSTLSLIVLAIGVIDTLILIYYIHHIARFIQVDEIINRCYREFTGNLENLFKVTETQGNMHAVAPGMLVNGKITQDINLVQCGYVQTIDYENLLTATDNIIGVDVHVRAGDFIVPGQAVVTIHSKQTLNEEILSFYRSCVVTGNRRTSLQDPEFSIKQLVEIALRALSPGINDPITAMSCSDRLTSSLILLAQQRFPDEAIVNTDNDIWLRRRTYSYASVFNTSFDQIRQAASSHADVMLHLLTCLQTLRTQLARSYAPIIDIQVEAVNALITPGLKSEKDKEDMAAAVTAARS